MVSHQTRTAISFLAALVAMPVAARPAKASEVGLRFEIRRSVETSSQRGDESSGNSSDRSSLVEQVIVESPDGLVLEFDLPARATKADRDREWQFPIRVLRSPDGNLTLLNWSDLESRVDRWLARGKIPKSACGTWYFTWNAFKIECDPQSALKSVEGFDIRLPDVREGAPFTVQGAVGTAALTRGPANGSRVSYVARLLLDIEQYRRGLAESDVVVAQVSREPLALSEAILRRAADTISGTIDVKIEVSDLGEVLRREIKTKVEHGTKGEGIETSISTEQIERLPLR